MPRDSHFAAFPRAIAVIGTGIAGLAAAWLLSRHHRVTVYEREGRIGGHGNTVDVPGPDGPIAVDTGFIVYNELNYPNLTQLLHHLGVATRASDMSFAASLDGGRLEYRGCEDLRGLFAQPLNALRPRFWRMLRDILRFYREGPALLLEPDADALTLGDYLDREGYSRAFVLDHLLPMGAAIWSMPVLAMRDHPATAFIRFCVNHALMQIDGRPQWRTVVGGSREYLRRLTASLAPCIRVNRGAVRVSRGPSGVVIHDAAGGVARYDDVVIATHADQALRLLAEPTALEQRVLGAFAYSPNVAVLHQDPRLMPRRRRVWSSWNYLRDERHDSEGVCVTYWMNKLQGLDPRVPLFVTLNPTRAPRAESILARFDYEHPIFDREALRAQRDLDRLQGARRTWFCGSYFGAGFHEDALTAGLRAAEAIGGVRRPWAEDEGQMPHLDPAWRRAAE